MVIWLMYCNSGVTIVTKSKFYLVVDPKLMEVLVRYTLFVFLQANLSLRIIYY